jgi:hypothetical protein
MVNRSEREGVKEKSQREERKRSHENNPDELSRVALMHKCWSKSDHSDRQIEQPLTE